VNKILLHTKAHWSSSECLIGYFIELYELLSAQSRCQHSHWLRLEY